MFDFIYAEESILNHPRTRALLNRFPRAQLVPLRPLRRGFQPHSAELPPAKAAAPRSSSPTKPDDASSPAPDGYGIGGERNYYFSHLLNCPLRLPLLLPPRACTARRT